MNRKIILGSHVSYKSPDYLVGSVSETNSYQGSAFMIFTGPPQNFNRKEIEKSNVEKAWNIMKENGIEKKDFVIHAPYLINLGSDSVEKRSFGLDKLVIEIERTFALGSKILILHPGNHLTNSVEEGIKLISEGINKALEITKKTDVIISIETMAGKGTEIGRTFEELKKIIDLVDDKNRIGVCLDTCHVHEAGYDISDPKKILKEFDDIVGLKYLNVIHLNDSKNEIGAKKDRHENIGLGKIGFETLTKWVHEPLLEDVPKILETPYYQEKPIYRQEITNLVSKKWRDYSV